MPPSYSTAIGCGLDDLSSTLVLVFEGNLGGFTSLDGYGSRRIGIILPILLRAVRFGHGVSAGFQIQGDNSRGVGHIVADDCTAGILHSEMPPGNSTTVGCGLDDLRLTSPLVGKGHRSSFIGFHCNRPGWIRIVDPVFIGTVCFGYRIGSGFQVQSNHACGIGHVVSDNRTAGVLHLEVPACLAAAIGGSLDNLGAAGYRLVHGIDGYRHIGSVLCQGHCPTGLSTCLIAIREYGFRHHIGTQGHLPRLGITVCIRGSDIEGIASILIYSFKSGTGQVVSVGVFLVDFNKAYLIHNASQLQMIPSCCDRGFGSTGLRQILSSADFRATGVAYMDNEMLFTAVCATDIPHGIGTGIDGHVDKLTVTGEYDDVTGNQICIALGFVGVLRDTAAWGVGEVRQTGFPAPYRGSRVACACCSGCLDRLMDVRRIVPFDIRQVVVDVVRNKGRTHQTAGFERRNIRCPTCYGTGISYGFVAVQERGIIVIADVGQHRRAIVVDVAGHIFRNVQKTIVLQPLHIIAGIGQCPENRVVIHIVRDRRHICQGHERIGICLEQRTWIEVILGFTIGIFDFRGKGEVFLNRIRKLCFQLCPADYILFFWSKRLCGLRGFCRLRRSFCCFGFRHIRSRRCVGRFRLCFLSCRRFRCFQRFCRFCWIRCFGGNRFRRIRGLSCCGFAAANVCCRHCLRGKSQDQNDGQQERKQPFADWFQMQFHPSWEQNKPPLFERRLCGNIQL